MAQITEERTERFEQARFTEGAVAWYVRREENQSQAEGRSFTRRGEKTMHRRRSQIRKEMAVYLGSGGRADAEDGDRRG